MQAFATRDSGLGARVHGAQRLAPESRQVRSARGRGTSSILPAMYSRGKPPWIRMTEPVLSEHDGDMRVDRLRIRNFKRFEDYTLELHPRFTLLVGDNGAGKTTILDALAVAAGVWLVKPPDSMLATSGRNILRNEIRLDIRHEGDRAQFVECKPVSITATGEISGHQLEWRRQIHLRGSRTSNTGAAEALRIVENHFSRDGAGENLPNPVIAYYGAGRAWLPSRARSPTGLRARRPARPLGGILRLLSGTYPIGRPENLVSTRGDRVCQSRRTLETGL